jgi:hypothetical protein
MRLRNTLRQSAHGHATRKAIAMPRTLMLTGKPFGRAHDTGK